MSDKSRLLEELQYFTRHGYAWPGGYPMYALTEDCGVLSHDAVVENYALIRRAMRDGGDKQWNVIAVLINLEDDNLVCDHTGERIESAYGEEEEA